MVSPKLKSGLLVWLKLHNDKVYELHQFTAPFVV
jgi:hypothetical protein